MIPGHGPLATYDELANYIAMLTTIRDRMLNLIRAGATLDEILAKGITSEWDEWGGDPERVINRAYLGLTHQYIGK